MLMHGFVVGNLLALTQSGGESTFLALAYTHSSSNLQRPAIIVYLLLQDVFLPEPQPLPVAAVPGAQAEGDGGQRGRRVHQRGAGVGRRGQQPQPCLLE